MIVSYVKTPLASKGVWSDFFLPLFSFWVMRCQDARARNDMILTQSMMILLLPVNMVVAKRFATVQKRILDATDARIHTTNEVLTNIRIIKFFAWEQRFLGAVDEKRVVELSASQNAARRDHALTMCLSSVMWRVLRSWSSFEAQAQDPNGGART